MTTTTCFLFGILTGMLLMVPALLVTIKGKDHNRKMMEEWRTMAKQLMK